MSKDPEITPTSIRWPTELKEAITRRAKANTRTFSQEVIAAMKAYVESTPEPKASRTKR